MQHKRISNQADVGDMVRGEDGGIYLVVHVEFATVDEEVRRNESPYVVVCIETSEWEVCYENLYDLNQDFVLEARADDMTVYY